MDGESCGSGPSLRRFWRSGRQRSTRACRSLRPVDVRRVLDQRLKAQLNTVALPTRSADGSARWSPASRSRSPRRCPSRCSCLPGTPTTSPTDAPRSSSRSQTTKAELKHSSKTLNTAAAAVTRTQVKLDAAQAQLAQTRRELEVARARDAKMAAKLNRTRAELGAAKSAVVAGQKNLDAQLALAGQVVRDQYQQKIQPVAGRPAGGQRVAAGSSDAPAVVDDDVRHRAGRDRRADRHPAPARDRQGAHRGARGAGRPVDRKAAAANLRLRQDSRGARRRGGGQRGAAPPGTTDGPARCRPGCGRRQAALCRAGQGGRIGRVADRGPDRQGQARRLGVPRPNAPPSGLRPRRARRSRRPSPRGSPASRQASSSKCRASRESRVPKRLERRARVLVPGLRRHHLAVRPSLPSDPALLEAARRHRLPRRLRPLRSVPRTRAGWPSATTTAAMATG